MINKTKENKMNKEGLRLFHVYKLTRSCRFDRRNFTGVTLEAGTSVVFVGWESYEGLQAVPFFKVVGDVNYAPYGIKGVLPHCWGKVSMDLLEDLDKKY